MRHLGCGSHISLKHPLCAHVAHQEFARHDEEPDRRSRAYTGTDPRSGAPFECAVRHERFLAAEVLFRPDFVSEEYSTPLPQVRLNLAMVLQCF